MICDIIFVLSYRYLATGGGVWMEVLILFLPLLWRVWFATTSANGLTGAIRATNSQAGALPL